MKQIRTRKSGVAHTVDRFIQCQNVPFSRNKLKVINK